MKTMKILIVGLALIMGSCANSSKTLQAVNKAYVGKSADRFFIEHGAPSSRYRLSDGGSLYRWNSAVSSISGSSHTNHHGTLDMFGNYNGYSTTTGGSPINMYTILQIEADNKNLIRSISIKEDTMGMWNFDSRFHELFKNYR